MREIDEQRAKGEKALGGPAIDKPVWEEFYSKIKAEHERRKGDGTNG